MSRNALIIDDDADVRLLVSMVLEADGYDTESAADGREGLACLRRMARTNGDLPVVVLDLQMPDIDGRAVLASIRSDPATAPARVLVCTVRTEHDDLAHLSALGADGFQAKPFDLDELVEAVHGLEERATNGA